MAVADELARLEDRLAALELELGLLRATLDEHVRTRRVVVFDDDGVERIVLDGRRRTGSVLVKLASKDGSTTGVEIYATESEVGPPEVGVCVVRDGNVVSRWSAG